ncbi:unnamed protein product, partial [Mesorhabditis spiculigera]
MLAVRSLPLIAAGLLLVAASPAINKRDAEDEQPEQPEAINPDRDLTEHCHKISEYSGEHYCEVFSECCCPDRQYSAEICMKKEDFCEFDNATMTVTDKKCVLTACYYPTTLAEVVQEEIVHDVVTEITSSASTEAIVALSQTTEPSETSTTISTASSTEQVALDAETTLKPDEETTAGPADGETPSGEIPPEGPEAQARPAGNGTEIEEEEGSGDGDGDGSGTNGYTIALVSSLLFAAFTANF